MDLRNGAGWRMRGLKRVPRSDLDQVIQRAFLSTCTGTIVAHNSTGMYTAFMFYCNWVIEMELSFFLLYYYSKEQTSHGIIDNNQQECIFWLSICLCFLFHSISLSVSFSHSLFLLIFSFMCVAVPLNIMSSFGLNKESNKIQLPIKKYVYSCL